MSKAAPNLDPSQSDSEYESVSNPLLIGSVPAEKKKEQVIYENDTIFCQFINAIDKAILDQSSLSPTQSLNDFTERKKTEFERMKLEMENKYCEHALHFTEKFGLEL